MEGYYFSKGISLYEALIELYKKYGFFKEETISLTLKGIEGLEKIKQIMTYFRENELKSFNNINIVCIKDYLNEIDNLPKSDVIKYFLEDGSFIAIRPSGTEPKLKIYIAVKGDTEKLSDEKLLGIKSNIDDIINKLL